MKFLSLLVAIFMIAFPPLHAQTTLDTARYRDAELFVQKKGYDVPVRLEEINSVAGKRVTVFELDKANRIRLTYTGKVSGSEHSKLSDKSRSTVLTVVVPGDARTANAYFPLTNSNRTRIYLTEGMK